MSRLLASSAISFFGTLSVELKRSSRRFGLLCVSWIGLRNSEESYRDSQVITASELSDLANVPKAGTHDDSLVSVLLVIIEYSYNALHTRVFLRREVFLMRCLVPIKNTANERRDEERAGLSSCDSLRKREHEGKVAVDAVLRLQYLGCFDTLPG